MPGAYYKAFLLLGHLPPRPPRTRPPQNPRKTSIHYPNDILATFGYDALIRMTNLAYSLEASNLLAVAYPVASGSDCNY